MVLRLPPITNPEKLKNLVSNFELVEKEINSCMLRRTGVEAGEANHMEVALDMNGHAILNASTDLTDGSSLLTLADADERYLEDVSADINSRVSKSGDSMSGSLDMLNNLIRNVATPVQDGDASPKKYIDDVETALKAYVDKKVAFAVVSVGDSIEGGVYAGTITYADGREYHLISAKASGELYGGRWGLIDTVTGAADPDDGWDNQQLILSSFNDGANEAFYHCRDYMEEGYDDWYLPARNELTLLYNNLAGHAEFSENVSSADYTWSSTEFDKDSVWGRRFSNGFELGGINKQSLDRRARPIRRIPV